MTTVATIAQRILDESGFSLQGSGGSLTNIEYLIDNVIDYINMECGITIADLSGAAGSKSLVGTDGEIVTVKAGVNLFLRARNEKGPNVAIQQISLSQITGDPHFTVYSQSFERMLSRLRGRTII